MVLILEVRNENKSCEEILVHFKVINGQSVDHGSQKDEKTGDCIGGAEVDSQSQCDVKTLLQVPLEYCGGESGGKDQDILRPHSADMPPVVLANELVADEKGDTCKAPVVAPFSAATAKTTTTAVVVPQYKVGGNGIVRPPSKDSNNGNSRDIINETIVLQTVSNAGAPKVPVPALIPRNPNVMDLNLYLNRVQNYLNHLGYHRQGEPRIRVLTNLSIKHQVETARSLIKAAEPIKCLHALVLAIHLTNCSNHIERFPINFKSDFNGKEYKHVVLGLYLYGMFGAIGISRDPGLQDKPAAYPRLLDLVLDFQRSYAESGHILREVKIGGIITHDPHSVEPIGWKIGTANMDLSVSDLEVVFERISRQLRSKMGATCLRNVRPTHMVYPTMPSTTDGYNSPTARTPSRLPQVKKSKTSSTLLVTSKKNLSKK